MSEDKKPDESKLAEPNVFLNPNDAMAILEICDIAIKAPNSNVDNLYGSKNALRNLFLKYGVLKAN